MITIATPENWSFVPEQKQMDDKYVWQHKDGSHWVTVRVNSGNRSEYLVENQISGQITGNGTEYKYVTENPYTNKEKARKAAVAWMSDHPSP